MNFTEKILCSLVVIWFLLCSPLIMTLGIRSRSFDTVSYLLGLASIYLGMRVLRKMSKTDPWAAEYFNDPLIARLRTIPLIKLGLLFVAGAVAWALIGIFAAASIPLPSGFMVAVFVLLLLGASLAWFARLWIWIIDKSKD